MQASCLVHREVRRKQLLSLLTAFIVPFESTSWVASRGSGRRAPAPPGSAAAALRARAARPAAARIRPPARRRRAAPPARPAAPAPPSSPAGRRCRPAPSPAGAAGLRKWVAVMSRVAPGAAGPPKSASAAEQPGAGALCAAARLHQVAPLGAVASGCSRVWGMFWLPVPRHVGASVLARCTRCACLHGMCFGGKEAAAVCHPSRSQESGQRSIETHEAQLRALYHLNDGAVSLSALTAELWKGRRACVTKLFSWHARAL